MAVEITGITTLGIGPDSVTQILHFFTLGLNVGQGEEAPPAVAGSLAGAVQGAQFQPPRGVHDIVIIRQEVQR